MPEFVKVEQEGRTLIAALPRPNVMNALHAPACGELSAVRKPKPPRWLGPGEVLETHAACRSRILPAFPLPTV
jgi:hypothetical protein